MLVDQQAHQLGHGDRRVGVVELDGRRVRQVEQVLVHVQVAAQQVLQRSRDEEVLLAQAQFLARLGAVSRVQHPRDAFSPCHLGHRPQVVTGIETFQVQLFQRPRTPQAQGIDAGPAPTDHRSVVGHRPHGLARPPHLALLAVGVVHRFDAAAKADGVDHLGALELPGVAEVQPVLGLLLLPAIDHGLAEKPVLVADAIAVSGNAQGRHALHEARRQAAKAAVAQRGIGLEQADALQVHVQPFQCVTGNVEQAQVAQAVVQQAADEEFEGKVIDPLLAAAISLAGVVHPVIDHVIARGQGDGFEPVVVEGVLRVLADRVGQLVQYSGAKFGHLGVTSFGFLGHAASSGKLTKTEGDC